MAQPDEAVWSEATDLLAQESEHLPPYNFTISPQRQSHAINRARHSRVDASHRARLAAFFTWSHKGPWADSTFQRVKTK